MSAWSKQRFEVCASARPVGRKRGGQGIRGIHTAVAQTRLPSLSADMYLATRLATSEATIRSTSAEMYSFLSSTICAPTTFLSMSLTVFCKRRAMIATERARVSSKQVRTQLEKRADTVEDATHCGMHAQDAVGAGPAGGVRMHCHRATVHLSHNKPSRARGFRHS